MNLNRKEGRFLFAMVSKLGMGLVCLQVPELVREQQEKHLLPLSLIPLS